MTSVEVLGTVKIPETPSSWSMNRSRYNHRARVTTRNTFTWSESEIRIRNSVALPYLECTASGVYGHFQTFLVVLRFTRQEAKRAIMICSSHGWSHTKIKCINSFQLLAITFLHDCVFPITIITIYCTLYYYHRSGCRQATVSLSVSLPRSHYTVSLHAHPNERPLSHELWLMDKNAIARECTVLYDVVGRFLLALQQRDDQVKKSLCKRGEDWGGSN